jgi:hypothetical protein
LVDPAPPGTVGSGEELVRLKRTSIRALSVVLAVLAGSALATASASDLLPPPIEAVFEDSFTPSKLPAHKAAPISLALTETIRNQDGSHPPALQELEIELDRPLALSAKGLPRCSRPMQDYGPRTDTLERCEDAKVGSGTIEVEVAFPEQQPVRTTGRVNVYNGGFSDGRTMFWLYAVIPAPVTGAIFVPLEFRRDKNGHYGLRGQLKLPKIANGSGSVTYLGARFQKGVFTASCPRGELQGHSTAHFVDGTTVGGAFTRACTTAASG